MVIWSWWISLLMGRALHVALFQRWNAQAVHHFQVAPAINAKVVSSNVVVFVCPVPVPVIGLVKQASLACKSHPRIATTFQSKVKVATRPAASVVVVIWHQHLSSIPGFAGRCPQRFCWNLSLARQIATRWILLVSWQPTIWPWTAPRVSFTMYQERTNQRRASVSNVKWLPIRHRRWASLQL